MNNQSQFDLIITCADGLEQALLIELELFGITAFFQSIGKISTSVTLKQFYHICLYSRVASRVLLPLSEYHFKTVIQDHRTIVSDDIANTLYTAAMRYDWTTLFGVDKSFAIHLTADKHQSFNQQFALMRVKDAIADTFNAKYGKRPNVNSKNPDFRIVVQVGSSAYFYLDLSGTSLHRRGYRIATTLAPLKENLACALLYECNWHSQKFDTLIDPMCGSGTFLTEGLLMALDYPVGMDKADSGQFGFYGWQHHDEALWQACQMQAMDKFHRNLDKPLPRIIGMDDNAFANAATQKNILASPLNSIANHISLTAQALHKLPKTLQNIRQNTQNNRVLLITNPPYGERLGDKPNISPLYQGLGLMVRDNLPMAYLGVLASVVEEADLLALDNPKTLRCHNGALTVYFRHGVVGSGSKGDLIDNFVRQEFDDNDATEFINRLQKNLTALKKQAKKHKVSNLRIYDADLPNFNIAIDIYGDKVHVQEYAPPKRIDPKTAKERFNLALTAIRQVFGINREDIFIKTRTRQAGNKQYERKTPTNKRHIVRECGAYFYVNFTDYLDTGLFIDHRPMRQILAEHSRGKHVLNLFAYTCSASVHMALAGAKSVTSVDLSPNYLAWGEQNFALNGLALGEHYRFINADVFDWIKNNTDKYQLIFIDPPTFSNSKKFHGTFDVQRDHVALINRAMNRLDNGGVLYFSNNFSRFVLDDELMRRYEVEEITHKTTGFDFKKGIHKSYQIRHKNNSSIVNKGCQNNKQKPNKRIFINPKHAKSNTTKLGGQSDE